MLGELYSFLVDLCQVRIERTGHRVLRRNLIHTVRYDSQCIGIQRHIGQQNQHLLVFLYGEILGSCKSHIRNQQTLYGGVLGRVHERNNTVQHAGVGKYILEVQVVIVGQTHTAQDDLVHLCTQGYVGHDLVVGLVGVCEERNLLTGHQRIIQVNTGNTGSNQFGWLFTTYRVYRRSANLDFLTFDSRSAIDWFAVGVKETSCQLVANLQRGSLAQEYHFGVGRNTFRTLEHLQGYLITHDFHHLSQFAVHGGQFVVTNAFGFQRTGCLCNGGNLCVDFLKSFCHISCYLFIYTFYLFSFHAVSHL